MAILKLPMIITINYWWFATLQILIYCSLKVQLNVTLESSPIWCFCCLTKINAIKMLLRRARDKKENNNTSPKYLQCISTSPNMADYITYYLNFLSCVLAILLLAEKKMWPWLLILYFYYKKKTLLATVDKTVI